MKIKYFDLNAYGLKGARDTRIIINPLRHKADYRVKNIIQAARQSTHSVLNSLSMRAFVRAFVDGGPELTLVKIVFAYNQNELNKHSDEYLFKHVQFILENFS